MVNIDDIGMFDKLKRVAKDVIPVGGQVWLYGSRARGTAKPDSDWDLLILLNQSRVTSKDEDDYAYPFVLEGWKNSCAVSPQIYTYEEWNDRHITPYYQNVEHDKLSIL